MMTNPNPQGTEEAPAPVSKVQKIIWTYGYRPFVMGGKTNYIRGAEVECEGPYDLGGGYSGYTVVSPSGHGLVVEATSGAIVMNDKTTAEEALRLVRKDIKEGDPEMMKEQVAKAQEEMEGIERESEEDFWNALKLGKHYA